MGFKQVSVGTRGVVVYFYQQRKSQTINANYAGISHTVCKECVNDGRKQDIQCVNLDPEESGSHKKI